MATVKVVLYDGVGLTASGAIRGTHSHEDNSFILASEGDITVSYSDGLVRFTGYPGDYKAGWGKELFGTPSGNLRYWKFV